MRWFIRLVLIVVVVLGTSACGLRLAYNHLDWLAMRWLNKQVTLTSAQELAFRDALELKLEWHCASELPNYASFLEAVRTRLDSDTLTVTDLEAMGDQAAAFGQRLIDRTLPSVVTLFASLSDEQVTELLAGVDERNAEFEEDRIDSEPEQRRRDRIEGMKRSLGRFIGRTTEQQDERLEAWFDSLLYVAPRMHSLQQQWRDKLAALLAQRDQTDTFGPALTALFQPAGDWPDDFRERMEYNRQRTLEALIDIHASLSRRQKHRLLSRIDSLNRDFQRLSCADDLS
jgi:hypothetical protein